MSDAFILVECKQIKALECIGRQFPKFVINRAMDGAALQIGNHVIQNVRQCFAQFEESMFVTEHDAFPAMGAGDVHRCFPRVEIGRPFFSTGGRFHFVFPFSALSRKSSAFLCISLPQECGTSHISVIKFSSAPWLFHTSCMMLNACFTPSMGKSLSFVPLMKSMGFGQARLAM